ncbi:TolC family protein [bacterium]|nr:TolC family protein [bacterium]MBU1956780.1 TolC family protein [bacterium]
MSKVIVLFLLLFTVSLDAKILTLKETINKTLNAHPDVEQFVLQIEQSHKVTASAKAEQMPQITLNATYNPTQTYVLPVNGLFNTKEGAGWNTGVTLKQKIWDFSQTTAKIDAQKVQEKIANFSLQEVKSLLAYRVKTQYELMQVQREAMAVQEQELKAKEALYTQAVALEKQGLKTQADTLRFLSAISIAKEHLAMTKANFLKAKTTLSLYINEPIEDSVELENSISKSQWNGEQGKKVLHQSPTLQGLYEGIQKNRLLHQSTKASRYGSVDVVVSYTHQNTLNQYNSTLVGVTYTLPIYTGGKTQSQIQQAQLSKQQAQVAYDSKALIVKEEYARLLIDLERYRQTLDAKTVQIETAKSTQDIMEARYKEGLVTYIEILDATTGVYMAQLERLEAQYAKSTIIHRLEYLKGETK